MVWDQCGHPIFSPTVIVTDFDCGFDIDGNAQSGVIVIDLYIYFQKLGVPQASIVSWSN